MTDRELITTYVRDNDEAAFDRLISRHRPFIRRILFATLGVWSEEAEEAEQEVLIALARGLSDFAFDAVFTTYLFRIVRNKGIDTLRRVQRHRRWFRPADSEAVDTDSPEDATLRSEERRFLYRVLDGLNPQERTLILLKEIDGYTLREAAELLGIPEGTAKSRLHRGRSKAAKIAARLSAEEE